MMRKIKVYENVTDTIPNGYSGTITPPDKGYFTLYELTENNCHIAFKWEKQDEKIGNGNLAFYSYNMCPGRYEVIDGKAIKVSDELPKIEEMEV